MKEISNIRILLVEDDELTRNLTVNVLSGWGYNIESVEDGQEAIDIMKDQEFDAVLMDLQMPRVSGLDATTYIRENYTKQMPILAVTVDRSDATRNKCIEHGMNDFLSKPVDPALLYSKLLNYL